MSRRLGQHFLFDPAILDRIVDALDPRDDDDVVEIGPGKGSLTRRLAPRVRTVVAIEKDEALARELQQAHVEHCTVIHGDALDVDWGASVAAAAAGAKVRPFKVVGNIPFSITTPLIDKALAEQTPVVVVFLVQREVADRLEAAPGTPAYGALTVGVQAAASVERLQAVKAGSFRPPPRVDSAIVRIRPRSVPMVDPGERIPFRRFVTGLFGQRRKQVARGLRTISGRTAASVAATLDSLEIASTSRPEVLTPQEFVKLFRAMSR